MVDLLDWPVVRQPTSLAFARSSPTSGLEAVVRSISANVDVGTEFGQTVIMADCSQGEASCGAKLIETCPQR
jgi:hypothetical protein